jgi:dipeptidyl aminopeptidase/acylaminoacyl peptidase
MAFRLPVLAGVPLLFAVLSAAAAAPPPSAEVFGSFPQTTDVVMSPNGNTLAWNDLSAPDPRIVFFDIDAQKYRRMVRVPPEVILDRLTWVDDETLLVNCAILDPMRSNDIRSHVRRVLAADISGGETRVLMQNGKGPFFIVTGVVAARTGKPKTVLLSAWDQQNTIHLYEVDTRTARGTAIAMGSTFASDWVVDKNTKAVARSEWWPSSSVYRVLARKGSVWNEIFRQKNSGELDLHGLTADGTAVLATGTMGQDRGRLVALPLDGSATRVVVDDPAGVVTGVVSDRVTGQAVAAQLGGLEQPLRWIDAPAERRFQSLTQSFPGRRVAVSGESDSRERLIARVDGPALPPTYYLVDFKTHKADIVGEAFPALANVQLGEVRTLTYKARDGVEIPAYLTLPPGTAGKKLPLVVLPHGGPARRDRYEFQWMAQFLAVRGFAVLQPEFRGSVGFGNGFQRAGLRQWGGLMQDDVSDGVKALIEQGVTEAGRVCIVGASDGYAGYVALAGAALTPDLFACAVSVGGVSDTARYIDYVSTHTTDREYVTQLREEILPPDERSLAQSPLRNADHVKIPVLLMYAEDSGPVGPDQSESMAAALGKRATLIRLEAGLGWDWRRDNRIRVLKEVETFLNAHLRTAAAPAAGTP